MVLILSLLLLLLLLLLLVVKLLLRKLNLTLKLNNAGSSKIGVIKLVVKVLGLGIKEAKEKVDSAPVVLLFRRWR